MLGAPLGGTTRGGHQGLESVALSLITPPNFRRRRGICLPSIVVVALGDPSSPVTCCATAVRSLTAKLANSAAAIKIWLNNFIGISSLSLLKLPLNNHC